MPFHGITTTKLNLHASPMKALTPPRLLSFMLLAMLLTSVLGCIQERPETTITRLGDAEAARLADSIRQAVSVQVAEGLS